MSAASVTPALSFRFLSFRSPRSPRLPRAAALALAALVATPALAADEVNIYTTREPGLIAPLIEAYTKATGVKVNTVFLKDGLLERVRTEGERSPADILMTVDIGNVIDIVDAGLTQPVHSETLEAVIPAHLRGAKDHWFALSLRDRVLYVSKEIDGLKAFTYEELADPKWRGKVCIRSGQHPYNTSLTAAMIAHNGLEATETWLRGVKANLARKAAGGDREVARDILGGICDIGVANMYYVPRMRSAEPGSDQRKWGEAINVVRPTFAKTGGTHVNISGASVARYAPNRDQAVKFLEFLVSEQEQAIYARANYEYPVRTGVALDPAMAEFGELKADTLPLTEITKYRKEASRLMDKVGFDN